MPTATQVETKAEAEAEAEGKKGGKFRQLWTKYGMVGITTYLGVYVVTLSGLYMGVKTGEIVPGDVTSLVKDYHLDALHLPGMSSTDLKVTKSTGDFMLAWVATKLTEPLRLAVTLAITPSISRQLAAFRRARRADADNEENKVDDNAKQ
ncbi:uncharacterized protein AMSG_02474 [Thecamonas trahens ATCC 50062]|uniref:DUF1279 domain-containing protein n=1 Tax=Thecamonas trahens ATCC 50062 TaxID=461836 RepID=A0A0L0D510_THETB|nr:hypothetical protein AMSG_02474 [Thecamonas trahens ATCC 50062]KNC47457.1 hypothetical protein AMSG_02474 [Thecamonas trahens ATCC 50062]|eukprot:XP_013759393.1 hypothetical protein AMSG_02474 [Thecamonas trahens ATCC 50062]